MQPFDANDYRGRVLKAVHARGGVEDSDPFEIYDIPVEEAAGLTDDEVAARLDAVWAYWQRDRDHPRYRGVILAMLERHSEISARLRVRAERAELADAVMRARAERADGRFAGLTKTVARLVERFGGVPEDRLTGLRTIAASAGIDEAEFAAWAATLPLVPAGTPERTRRRQVAPDVLRQIRADLDELGRIVGLDPPRSLFALLGLEPGSDREKIRAARDVAFARNRARRPDRRRALLDDLLAMVGLLLVDGDPEAYLDALVPGVTEQLRPRVVAAVLAEDRLLPADAEEFLAAARDEGLDVARAVAVVTALAREAGVDDAAVRLAASNRSAPGAGASARDDRDTPTAAPRPPVPRVIRPAAATSPRPVPPVPASAPAAEGTAGTDESWRAVLAQARSLLESGRPIAASTRIGRAVELAGVVFPEIRALADQIEAVIHRAGQRWEELDQAAADNRVEQALALADELARSGSDVLGAGGKELAPVRAALHARLREAVDLVARATQAPLQERAALAVAALAVAADHGPARALLAEHLAPPEQLRVTRGSGAIEIAWSASPVPGVVYRVVRVGADGRRRAVGTTPGTQIEDGGVPASAELPGYEVLVGVAGVWSDPAVWPEPVTEAALAEQEAVAESVEPAEDSTRLITRTPADALPPARDLTVVDGRLRWVWPDGCTEMIVVWRPDAPPVSADDPAARKRKITNARYEVEGGLMLPADRPLYVAVFGCVRVTPSGPPVVASFAPAPARCLLRARDRA